MKRKIIILILGSVLISTYFIYRYNYYITTKNKVYDGASFNIINGLQAFYADSGFFPAKRSEFEYYLLRNENYYFISNYLERFDYHIIQINDTFCVYINGYDNDNDSCETFYYNDSCNFYQSLFINGDLVLLKWRMTTDSFLKPISIPEDEMITDDKINDN